MESMEVNKVLVTGSEGYIGSVLVQQLLENGYNVTGLDTCFFKKNPKRNHNLIKKDVRDVTEKDLYGYDGIVHLAALSNDPMGALDNSLTNAINFMATAEIAKKAKKVGVKRFLFSSSCSIYGIAKSDVVDETSEINPLTQYARSKIDSEKALQKLADKSFCVGLLRNSTVYGYSPNFRNDLVVNNLVACALATNTIKIMSDGTPWRPLIDVRDLSRIFIEFLTADPKLINAQVINIGFEENNVQVKDIVGEIQKQLPKCEVIFTGEHGKDSRSYKVNFSKLRKIFKKLRQLWPIQRSVADLMAQIPKQKLSNHEFYKNIYTRIEVLKKLSVDGKLDKNLKWIK